METFLIPYKEGELLTFCLGLKELIYLAKLSDINEVSESDIIYAGIKREQPQFPYGEISSLTIPRELHDSIKAIKLPTSETIEEWYKKGIGEIGLSLSTFYCLTPYELDLAYEGYLRRQEMQANLIKLAVLEAQKDNNNLIKIVPERKIFRGSLTERENIFKQLNIQEEEE